MFITGLYTVKCNTMSQQKGINMELLGVLIGLFATIVVEIIEAREKNISEEQSNREKIPRRVALALAVLALIFGCILSIIGLAEGFNAEY